MDPAVFYPFATRASSRDGILTSRKCDIQSQGKYRMEETAAAAVGRLSKIRARNCIGDTICTAESSRRVICYHLLPRSAPTAKATLQLNIRFCRSSLGEPELMFPVEVEGISFNQLHFGRDRDWIVSTLHPSPQRFFTIRAHGY